MAQLNRSVQTIKRVQSLSAYHNKKKAMQFTSQHRSRAALNALQAGSSPYNGSAAHPQDDLLVSIEVPMPSQIYRKSSSKRKKPLA